MDPFAAIDEPWLTALVGDAKVPGRRIRASRYSVTGRVATTKAAKSQDSESLLEHDFLNLLEFDLRVERFVAQPFTLKWNERGGGRLRYTPDAIAKFSLAATRADPSLRTTLYEIKPRAVLKADWAALKPKFRAAIRWALDRDCRFKILTEQEIRTPYLKNVRFLLQYRSQFIEADPYIANAYRLSIRNKLYEIKTSTPRGLLGILSSDPVRQAMLLPWLWNLINRHEVGINLADPLTMCSEIWTLDTSETIGGAQ